VAANQASYTGYFLKEVLNAARETNSFMVANDA
jgi:hypothetical protein